MSAIETMLAGPLAQAIGWALLHLLWQGVLVAAILAATLALLQRQNANARYLASCGALLLLVALGVATAYRAYDPIVLSGGPPSSAAPSLVSEESSDAPVATTPVIGANTVIPNDTLVTAVSYASSHLPQVVAIWLAGVLILSVRLGIGWIGAHRLTTRRSYPAGPGWESALARIGEALQLRRSIKLLESAAVEVPTVIGWLRPVVLLPVASLSGLSIQQIEMILAHELAHIRRHDFIVNLMQSVVETLLFYHPAVWWISGRIRVEREHCCDDLAVAVFGDPVQYARALTRFEELRVDAAQSVVAANGGSLFDRIRRLVVARAESANWSSRWAAGAALLTVVVAVVIAPSLPLFAEHAEQSPAPPPKASTPKPEEHAKDSECPTARTPHADVDVEVDASADEQSAESAADDMTDAVADSVGDGVADGVEAAVEAGVEGGIEGGVQGGVGAAVARAIPFALAHAVPAGMSKVQLDQIVQNALEIAPVIEVEPKIRIKTKIGSSGKLSVDDLITLRTSGVTAKYIEDMRSAGLGDLTLDDIVSMRIQGVSPEYVRGLREAGVEIKSADSVVALRVQGVTPKWIAEIKSAGYPNLTLNELIAMRVQGVSSEYVRGMAASGFPNLSVRDITALRIQGVSPQYIQDLARAGYKNLSANEVISLRVQGVDSNFINALAQAGYANLSTKELIKLKVSGVDADFIRDLAKYRTK